MLRSLVCLLCISPVIAGEMSWVTDLNRRIDDLSQSHQAEARSIVDQITKASQHPKRCSIAQSMVQKSQARVKRPPAKHSPDLMVFVSFSMPLETLRTLNNQVTKQGGKLVFRGLVEGSFKKMVEKLKKLEAKVLIDPTLFDTYQVTRVPVFIRGQNRLAGNVSLEYALARFERRSP